MAKKMKKKKSKNVTKPAARLKQLASSLYTMAHELPVYGDWLDDIEIEKIENDPVVLSSISKRKAATLKKELIVRASHDAVSTELARIMNYSFRSQVLDTVLQGMSVFELNWQQRDGYWYPVPVERDYRAFSMLDGKLIYEFEEVDPRKVLQITHRAKFNAQLGRPLYSTLFWLRRFKASSMEFWVEFMERFGKPWIVGKTDADKNEMAQELYAMLGGDVAVIENEDSIDMKTPSDKAGFREILSYLDDQIREAITGGNLTGNVSTGSYAATQTHKEISEEISMSDANLLEETIADLIEKFRELNHYSGEISFALADKDAPHIELAGRDKTLSELMGGRFVFTESYLKQTYNIDIEPQTRQTLGAKYPIALTQKPQLPQDEIDVALAQMDTEPQEDAIFETLQRIFAEASTYEEAYDKLKEAFASLDEALLFEEFERYLSSAMLYGNAEAGVEDAQA